MRAGSDARLKERWERVVASNGVDKLLRESPVESNSEILVPMKVREGSAVLTWFNTLAVFGATSDVTLDELVVESFFPGDDFTRGFVNRLSEGTGSDQD